MTSKIKLGLLGPDGTFTAEAGIEYSMRRELEPEMVWYKTIEECFAAVEEDEVDRAVVPILNSTRGASWVNETLKRLRDSDVMIYDEQILQIRHNLAALPGVGLEDIRYIHSKDKALQQCRKNLLRLCPYAEFRDESSTAAAAQKIRKLNERQRSALVPKRAAELYNLEILAEDVQDYPNNKTRFIVISRHDNEPTGKDKTTAIFEFHGVDRPSLLYNIMKELAERNISLAYLQSIPKDGELDEFTFYCDIHGHRKDRLMSEAIKTIERDENLSYWKVLGSYPIFRP